MDQDKITQLPFTKPLGKLNKDSFKTGCNWPFEAMFLHQGWITTCCPNWIDASMHGTPHNRYSYTPMELWNHKAIQRFRKKILKDDYSSCQKCPIYINKTKSAEGTPRFALCRTGGFDQLPEGAQEEMGRGPTSLYIADSFVCNLCCWSCRFTPVTTEEFAEEKDNQLWQVMREFAPGLKHLDILGAGEVFASPRHIRLMHDFNWSDYPDIKISVISNGTLLKRSWDKIKPAHQNIRLLWISIDAATKKTYEAVRRPAKWEQVIEGIEFAITLDLELFQTNFVVRADNVHEMAQFAHDMLGRGSHHVMFVQLQNTHMPGKAYKSQNVFNPEHPLHERLLDQLQDPIFKDHRVTVQHYMQGFKLP